ncbi:MAG: NUDIX hydrolase [Sphaerochaetaceae bacterium]|nr:NUDIX hydrolase [Sphaerochaetaceae bacterium]
MRFPYRGAGIGLIYEDKILMGLRAKKPFKNTWCVPGGGREKTLDHSDMDTARREFSEETGLKVDFDSLKSLGVFSLKAPFFSWKTFFFRSDRLYTDFVPDEFYELKWFSLDDIKKETAGHSLRPFAVSEIKLIKRIISSN